MDKDNSLQGLRWGYIPGTPKLVSNLFTTIKDNKMYVMEFLPTSIWDTERTIRLEIINLQ